MRGEGEFVDVGQASFDLIETMRFEAAEGFIDLERHLNRMKASAEALGFAFNRHQVRNELQAACFPVRFDARVRIRLARSGATAVAIDRLPLAPDAPVAVRLAPRPVAAGDFRLRHKTSDRRFLDAAREAAGSFEVAFLDEEGRVTEGSFTNRLRREGWPARHAAGHARPPARHAQGAADRGRPRLRGGTARRGSGRRLLHRQHAARPDAGEAGCGGGIVFP